VTLIDDNSNYNTNRKKYVVSNRRSLLHFVVILWSYYANRANDIFAKIIPDAIARDTKNYR